MAVNASTFTQKILFTGSEAAIAASTISNDGLYFATDTKKLYKGSVDYSQAARVVTALPETLAKNSLYIVVDGSGNFVKAVATDASSNQKVIGYKTVTAISASTASMSDEAVPTEAAVKTYVDGLIGGGSVVSNVAAGAAATTADYGELLITKGDGSTSEVTVPGVALKPVWDSVERRLQIPYTAAGESLAGVIDCQFGKDLVVTEGKYNAVNETIELWITGHSSAAGDDPDIVIPVSSLVDEIQGGTTNTAVTTYTPETNTLTADVRVSALANNALEVKTGDATAANNGLFISLEAYATTAALADVAADVAQLDSNMSQLYNAVTTWVTLDEPEP